MNRRDILASLAALGLSPLAGCGVGAYPYSSPPTRLAWLAVSNYDEERGHEFDLRVERDGELVHESTHVVERKPEGLIPGAVADCTWDDVPGQFVVSARVDGGDWTEANLGERFDEPQECVVARANLGRFGSDGLVIAVRDWCDEVDGFRGGCPAYKSPSSQSATTT